jgi:hypothetical protein
MREPVSQPARQMAQLVHADAASALVRQRELTVRELQALPALLLWSQQEALPRSVPGLLLRIAAAFAELELAVRVAANYPRRPAFALSDRCCRCFRS